MNDLSVYPRSDAGLADGLVICQLVALDGGGEPLIRIPFEFSHRIAPARTAVPLDSIEPGSDVVVMFDRGDPDRPIILGRLLATAHSGSEVQPGTAQDDCLGLTAEREITLRCGKASITLTRSGKIILRGTYILSRASGPNKIKGGSIELN